MALPARQVRIAFGALPGAGEPAPGAWVDVSAKVKSIAARGGRSIDMDRIESATAVITLDNADARFTPENTQSPYWPNVLPFVPIEIRWDVASVPAFTLGTAQLGQPSATLFDVAPPTSRIFRGLVESWPWEWYKPTGGQMTINAVDIFRYFTTANLAAVAFAQQTVGTRIAAVLAAIGNPFPSAIDSGGVTLAADTISGAALDYMMQLADYDGGLFYASGDGKITFNARTTLQAASQYKTVQATFGDGGASAGEIPYTDLAPSTDEQVMINDVTAQLHDGTVMTPQDDLVSQSYYLKRNQDWGTTPLVNMTELTAAARSLLVAKCADRLPRLRLDQLKFNLLDPQVDASTLIGLGLWYRVKLIRRPDTGDVMSVHCLVQGIAHEITQDTWVMTIVVTWIPTPFILGQAVLGASLGGSALG